VGVEPTTRIAKSRINGSGTGGFMQGAAGAFKVLIGGTTPGTQFSQMNMTAAVSLAGTLNVSLINGFIPVAGNQFTILNGASVTGQFTTVNVPALPGNLVWNVAVNATSVVLSVTNVTATLVSIAVTPANQTVAAGTPVQFTATGTFSDNSTQNLTNPVTWISSDPTIATISAAGLASTLQKVGSTTISAQQGNIIGSTTLTVTVTPTSSLTVSLAGSGGGTVTSDKRGINCPEASFSANFAQGTVVTVTAVANTSSTFTGWSAPCEGTGTCVFTMNSNQAATANFVLGNQPVTIAPGPGGGTTATVDPSGTAVFPLVLTSTGFTGSVTLTCASRAGPKRKKKPHP
jgi:hypothetical protein